MLHFDTVTTSRTNGRITWFHIWSHLLLLKYHSEETRDRPDQKARINLYFYDKKLS